jgi:hypothetical protein
MDQQRLGDGVVSGDRTSVVVEVWPDSHRQAPPLQDASQACSLASPHSSAFVDINGDCLPGKLDAIGSPVGHMLMGADLVLHCTRPRSSHHSIQIWTNRGPDGFALARSYDLPRGSGPLTFADMSESLFIHRPPLFGTQLRVSPRPRRLAGHRLPDVRSALYLDRRGIRLQSQHRVQPTGARVRDRGKSVQIRS